MVMYAGDAASPLERRRTTAPAPAVAPPPPPTGLVSAPGSTLRPEINVARQPTGATVTPGTQPAPVPQTTSVQPPRPPTGTVPAARPPVPPGPQIHPPAPPAEQSDDFLTPFGPGDDLRFEQINPLATARLRQLQAGTDAAAGQVGQGPSLSEAAAEQFRLLGEQSAEQRQQGIRSIGQAAAKFGRLGSGMTTNQLTSLEDLLRTREDQARRGLSSEVAQGEAANRRANLGARAGLEGQVYGQEAGQRDELRGERGYQSGTAQQTLDNRIRQQALEESLTEGVFGRELAQRQLGLQGSELQSSIAEGESGAAGDVLSQIGLEEALARYGPDILRRRGTRTPDAVGLPDLPG